MTGFRDLSNDDSDTLLKRLEERLTIIRSDCNVRLLPNLVMSNELNTINRCNSLFDILYCLRRNAPHRGVGAGKCW